MTYRKSNYISWLKQITLLYSCNQLVKRYNQLRSSLFVKDVSHRHAQKLSVSQDKLFNLLSLLSCVQQLGIAVYCVSFDKYTVVNIS